MNNDFARSLERVARSEAQRANLSGFGTTRQGQALARHYHTRLAETINASRATGRPKHIWKALRGHENDYLALRLLIAGVSVCYAPDLGSDDDGQKNFRDIALWIGRNLGQRGRATIEVGGWGINILLSLPLFELAAGDVLHIPETDDLTDFLADVLERGVKANPLLSPLLTPPEPWTQVRRGGLPADHWANVPLIREHHPSIEEAARKAIGTGKMQPLLDALNALQRVAFTINEPVLDYIKRTTDVAPTDAVIAEAMAAHGRFYVPLNIDFRGRVYAIPHFNFQREDCVRALFQFADGEPIGEEGLKHLKAHVAACADGTDWSPIKKPSDLNLAKRIEWTESNLPLLRKIGEAALGSDNTIKWPLPKKPYQFIAACLELVEALDKGPDFITRLPLTFDASCSGLQHLCAMTRDEKGARYVNLIPSLYRPPDATEAGDIREIIGAPTTEETEDAHQVADDFYQRVAVRVFQNPECRGVMDGALDRAIVKQPSMSYFYGAVPGGFVKNRAGKWRPYGMTKQVADVLAGRGIKNPKAAKLIAYEINSSIEGVVPKAKEVRDFLEGLAEICAERGLPLRWTTPLGLPVINRYHEPEIKIIPVSLKGRRRRVKLVVGDKPGIAKKKATNAVTANFVHSIDAAHLQFVALAADKEGFDLVTVHDCFGATAPRAARLNEIIREEFVRLHKRHNLLVEVRESAKRDLRVKELPPFPAIGSAEIEDVLGSFHAFK
jgi:DNA-directed RNA polymerase